MNLHSSPSGDAMFHRLSWAIVHSLWLVMAVAAVSAADTPTPTTKPGSPVSYNGFAVVRMDRVGRGLESRTLLAGQTEKGDGAGTS